MTKWKLVSCEYLDVNKTKWVDLPGYMPEGYTIYLDNDQDFVTTFEDHSRAVHFIGNDECRIFDTMRNYDEVWLIRMIFSACTHAADNSH